MSNYSPSDFAAILRSLRETENIRRDLETERRERQKLLQVVQKQKAEMEKLFAMVQEKDQLVQQAGAQAKAMQQKFAEGLRAKDDEIRRLKGM